MKIWKFLWNLSKSLLWLCYLKNKLIVIVWDIIFFFIKDLLEFKYYLFIIDNLFRMVEGNGVVNKRDVLI